MRDHVEKCYCSIAVEALGPDSDPCMYIHTYIYIYICKITFSCYEIYTGVFH